MSNFALKKDRLSVESRSLIPRGKKTYVHASTIIFQRKEEKSVESRSASRIRAKANRLVTCNS